MKDFKDYIGQKVGKLLILSISPCKNYNKTWYLCECECGRIRNVNASKLLRGIVKGCQNCKNKGAQNARWTGYEEISGTYLKNLKSCANSRSGEKAIYTITDKYLWDLFIEQGRKCKLSGLEIAFSKNAYAKGTASLDRIDSAKGYIIGNVQWVHKDVNKIKTDLKQENFLKLCKLITMNELTIKKRTKSNNQVNLIKANRDKYGIWWFDDDDLEIFHEVFVGDINFMIDMLVPGESECLIYCSKDPIAGQNISLTRRNDLGQGMYQMDGTDVVGWLCPCLLNYLPDYTEHIYARVEKLQDYQKTEL